MFVRHFCRFEIFLQSSVFECIRVRVTTSTSISMHVYVRPILNFVEQLLSKRFVIYAYGVERGTFYYFGMKTT